MNTFILELAVTHSILIFAYWLFLSKEHQFSKMRFFLIGSTILSVVIPLLKLPKLFSSHQVPIYEFSAEYVVQNTTIVTSTTEASSFDYNCLLYTSPSPRD